MNQKLTIAFMAGVFSLAMAASANISGSAHDFQAAGWNTGAGTNQTCVVCHTPHAAKSDTFGPLWNHDTNTTSYTTYDTLGNATYQGGAASLGPESLACLSCHDGTVALDAYGSHSPSATKMTGAALVGSGGDLTTEHPIGFAYDNTLYLADGGLNDPSTLSDVKLFNDKLECASCHDVHDMAGNGKLLRIDNSGSALCTECHNK
ncbi:MAG TPA: cytochrome c3 family protein [Pontiella sp.]